MDILFLILAGMLAGLFGGLLGLGGGFIFLPAVYLSLEGSSIEHNQLVPLAIATSLTGVLCNTVISSFTHAKKRSVNFSEAKSLLPFILCGSIAGSFAVLHLNSRFLISFYGVFILYVGGKMLCKEWEVFHKSQQPAKTSLFASAIMPITKLPSLTGCFTGFLSVLLGIGGGTFSTPYFHWVRKMPLPEAVGTASLCGTGIALASLCGFLLQQEHFQVDYPGVVGFFYTPGLFMIAASLVSVPLGVRWCHRWKPQKIRIIFGFLLLLLGVRIFL